MEHTAATRDKAKTKGHALPPAKSAKDTSTPRFPIEDEADLRKAIRLAGSAKGDPSKVRAYIKRRASALGKSNLIPSSWS